jgi:hypothetical protein
MSWLKKVPPSHLPAKKIPEPFTNLSSLVRAIPSATENPSAFLTSLGIHEVLAALPPAHELNSLADEIDLVTKALLRYQSQVLGTQNAKPRQAAIWLDSTPLSPPNWLSDLRHHLFESSALLLVPTRPDTLRHLATLIERLHNQVRSAGNSDYRTWPTIATALRFTLAELAQLLNR